MYIYIYSLESIMRLEARIMNVGKNQEALDEVYEEVVRVLKNEMWGQEKAAMVH